MIEKARMRKERQDGSGGSKNKKKKKERMDKNGVRRGEVKKKL